MATMPGQNEQPKPASPGGANEQRDPKHSRPTETTKQTMPGSPIQPGQQYETPEPKRRETGPQSEAKRAPEHEPGYEAKHQKEAKQQTHQDDANRRSQADDSAAKRAEATEGHCRKALNQSPLPEIGRQWRDHRQHNPSDRTECSATAPH